VTKAIVHASHHPVILAGGLTPDNVAMAIRTARPAGVDAHTGLEGPYGEKDPERVQQFVEEARATFREVGITPGGGTSPKNTCVQLIGVREVLLQGTSPQSACLPPFTRVGGHEMA